jgi:hypothetical protein
MAAMAAGGCPHAAAVTEKARTDSCEGLEQWEIKAKQDAAAEHAAGACPHAKVLAAEGVHDATHCHTHLEAPHHDAHDIHGPNMPHGPQYPPVPPHEREVVHLHHTGNLDPVTGKVLYNHLQVEADEIYQHTHDAKLLPEAHLHHSGEATPQTPHVEPHVPKVLLKKVSDLDLVPKDEEHAHLENA